ncbi:hypothetical protein DJ82_01215 [Halorubrum sp. Ib24]|uniref:DUF7504 family protein n=1 Tax=Halorubrum sp. Ib24 TaxID=1383850 RepID=UPI000B98D2C5|nr:hypothetical protein [Halorubrum sp. Ib24]OYR43010.1 hypothetical protein DJ82_01215 [Halorubrum sp. Ib24]
MTESYQSLNEHLTESSSILLLAPSDDSPDDRACVDLLTREPPDETNVLSVTLSASPSDRLSIWRRESGEEFPARTTIFDGRRGETDGESGAAPESESMSVRRFPEHADLHDIGLAIAEQIGAWRDTDEATVMCFHSLTTLFAAYDADRVVSLITSLNDLCDSRDVIAHHHVDPKEFDAETVTTLRPLYDAVLEYTPEVGWIPTEREEAAPAPSFDSTTPPPGGRAKTDPDRPETVPMRHSFDTLLDLLSSPRRRTLLYYLKNRSEDQIPLDELVEDVRDIERALPVRDSAPREKVRTELRHTHLPKLREVGIVRYDAGSQTVHYTENQGLESYLDYVETVELG